MSLQRYSPTLCIVSFLTQACVEQRPELAHPSIRMDAVSAVASVETDDLSEGFALVIDMRNGTDQEICVARLVPTGRELVEAPTIGYVWAEDTSVDVSVRWGAVHEGPVSLFSVPPHAQRRMEVAVAPAQTFALDAETLEWGLSALVLPCERLQRMPDGDYRWDGVSILVGGRDFRGGGRGVGRSVELEERSRPSN